MPSLGPYFSLKPSVFQNQCSTRFPSLLLHEERAPDLRLLQVIHSKTESSLVFCRFLSWKVFRTQSQERRRDISPCLWSKSPSDPGLRRLGISSLYSLPLCVLGPETGVTDHDGQELTVSPPLPSSSIKLNRHFLGLGKCFLSPVINPDLSGKTQHLSLFSFSPHTIVFMVVPTIVFMVVQGCHGGLMLSFRLSYIYDN